jgi:PLD-like domain
MQPSRARSLVASLIAILLVLSLEWVALADPAGAKSRDDKHNDKHSSTVRATSTAKAHASARRTVRVKRQARVKVTVVAVVRRAKHGKPAKKASATAVARAVGKGRAVRRAHATVSRRASARAPTKRKARVKAYAKAYDRARARAHAKAAHAASVYARDAARKKAWAAARRLAHYRAVYKAWAKLPGDPVAKRVRVTHTAHASARRRVRVKVHVRARAFVTRVSRPDIKSNPVGRATVSRVSRAKGVARATRRAHVRVRVSVVGHGPTTAIARRRAHLAAVHRSRRLAHQQARAKAYRLAHHVAAHHAKAKAKAKALHRSRVRAARRATWLARLDRIDPKNPATWIRYRPRHITPRTGPLFNNPYGSQRARRTLLAHVIHAIKSSMGYRLTRDPHTHKRLRCPTNPKYYPSEIKIAVYSIADKRFADALVAAKKRCVSVQVLMNSHLTVTTSHSWGHIFRSLGRRKKHHWHKQRNFAHRCTNGCLGTSVLHSKIYLFSHAGRARSTVMTGSSNMTKNAIGIQWNDLYTVNGNAKLYSQYRSMFRRMVPDHMRRGPYVYKAGKYTSTFYPFRNATKKTDRTMRDLRTIKCSGARGGTGINGHTVIYIAMHAWFSGRGEYLAKKVRQLYNRGCYVRILYSFLSHGDYWILKHGTGHRMIVRRVLFSGRLGLVAVKYSHMKMLAISGHLRNNHRARVVWTGSNNWVNKSLHADEVTLRIPSATAYRRYVQHWKQMLHRRSSPYWATFEEPTGGGRAP